MTAYPAHFHATELGETDAQQIIWLHGWGQKGNSFLPLATLFEHSAHNIIFDLPGFGKTPHLEKGAGTEAYAHALRTQLNKKKCPRILIGHSFGCRVAVQFAAAYPEEVDALVFIAGAGLKRKRSLAWKLRATFVRFLGRCANIFDALFKSNLKSRYSERFGSRDYRNAGPLRETFVNVVNEDLSTLASTIDKPVLLIYGSEDNEAPVEIGAKYEALMRRSTLKVLDGYNHFDILTRGAHKCQFLIDKFIANGVSEPQ